jgi:transcriptional regulator with XRE-family HTH domain
MNISELIKSEREKRGMTQKELGKAIGVNATQVSRIEINSESVTMKTLKKYLDFFGLEIMVV